MTYFDKSFSSDDFLARALKEFIITFVSCPLINYFLY